MFEFARIIDLMPGVVFVKDRDDRLLMVNQAFADLYQMAKDDLVGRRHADVHPCTKEMEQIQRDDRVAFLSQTESTECLQPLTNVHGETRWTRMTRLCEEGDQSTEFRLLCVAHDEAPTASENAVGDGPFQQWEQKNRQQREELADVRDQLAREVSERRQGEQVVRDSEALYASLVENLPVHVIRKDLEGRFLYVSPSFCKLLGKSDAEIVDKTDLDLFPEKLARKYQRDDDRVLETGEVYVTIEENQSDGKTRSVEVMKAPVRNAKGDMIGVQVSFWDVSARTEAETALEQERYLLHSLMDNLPHNIYFKDAQSRFIRINKALTRWFGLDYAEQVFGKTDFDIFTREHAEQALADEQSIIRSGEPIIDREEKETWRDGRVTWALSTKMPLYDAEGNTIGTFGVSRDITEQKLAAEALRASEMKFRTLYDSSRDAIMILTPDEGFTSGNPAAIKLFGCRDESDFTSRSPVDLSPPRQADGRESGEKAMEMITTAMENGSHFFEWTHRRTDGSNFPATVLLTRMVLQGVPQLQATVRDITEQKQTAELARQSMEAAEAANRAKSDFLARMSHEIRTPMNAIIGMTELVLDTELAATQREYLEIVQDASESLLSLINDILDFSKIEAGKLELRKRSFRLREGLGDTLKSLAVRAHNKGLELASRFQPEVPDRLVGDLDRLRQIVVNLLGNAIKFTNDGEIVLSVEMEEMQGDEVVLHFQVTDTGVGIPADKLTTIFDAFEQADRFRTRRHGGTGLGLAICARLVELMKGRIWVDSELGQGSVFHFTARFTIAGSEDAEAERQRLERLHGLPVLVVDDHSTNRRIVDELLRSWQLCPMVVESVSSALARLHEAQVEGRPFPLLITDAQMPDQDGFDLVEAIRDSDQLTRPVIVMLTSSDQTENLRRCEQLGVVRCLIKPVKQRELLDAILFAMGHVPESLTPTDAAANQGPSRPLSILLAEDSPVNQKLAVAVLQKQGHEVTVVENGREAISLLEDQTFDLVLMDLQMPVMDGLEATRRIRRREHGTGDHIPIVAMTAHALKGDREHCLQAGMDGYIAKPIRVEKLHQVITHLTADRD